MSENKRFELTMNGNEVAQYEIIDHNQENLTVYNNLGNVYFSYAMKVCELLNSLADENEQLKNRVDELEDDNMKYTLSTDKLEEYTKRFVPTKCINEFRDCKTNRYYWLDNEDNFAGALELLNLLDCENEQLKKQLQSIIKLIEKIEDYTDDIKLIGGLND